jgi:hypothetical protein
LYTIGTYIISERSFNGEIEKPAQSALFLMESIKVTLPGLLIFSFSNQTIALVLMVSESKILFAPSFFLQPTLSMDTRSQITRGEKTRELVKNFVIGVNLKG